MKLSKRLLISSVASTFIVPVLAQDTLKITVTGTRSPKPVDSFPGSIEVLDKDDLDTKTGYSIRELFNEVPGVTTKSVKRNGVVGPTDAGTVNIRGLDFKRILFQVDGSRLPESYKFSTDNGSRQYYTMSQGGYVDFNTLAGLEIFKGPASALYGSDALGGVVSYRTLVPEDLLKGNKKNIFEIPVNYNSSNDGLSESIKFATKLSDKTSAILVYTKEDANELKVKADNKYIDDETHKGNNYFGKIVQKFSDFSEGILSYENVDRDAEIKVKSDNLTEMNSPAYGVTYLNLTEKTNRYRDKITAQFKFDNPDSNNFFKYFSIKGYSQYAKVNDNMDRTLDSYVSRFSGLVPVRTEERKYYLKNDSAGGEIEIKSNLYDKHELTYGFDYSNADISRLRTTISSYSGTSTAKDTPDTNIKRTGVYLQDEFSLDKFDFIAGIRYDNYELDAKTDSIVTNSDYANDFTVDNLSPKLAFTYNFNDNFSGYASYAKGFRAPTYYELNGNFSSSSREYRVLSNPNLKSETSDGYEVGLRGNTNKSNFKLSAFLNKYSNFIQQFVGTTNTSGGDFDGYTDYKSENVEKAEISGYELSYKYFLKDNREGINLFTNLAYSEGDNTTDNVPLTSVNPFEIKYGIGFNSANNKFSSKLTNTHVGKARVASGTTTFVPDSYTVTDLELAYSANKTSELTAGIYNIFDNTYYNYQDVQGLSATLSNLTKYTQPGTHFRVGFKFNF